MFKNKLGSGFKPIINKFIDPDYKLLSVSQGLIS